METLDELIARLGAENVKVVRICEYRTDEYYAMSREEHDRKADELWPSQIFDVAEYEKYIRQMIDYIRRVGVKFEPTRENWEKLNFPIACFYFWR
jgi:hypothetical protein